MRLFGLKLNSLLVIAVAALLALGAISAFADDDPDHPGDGVTVDDGDTDGEGEGNAFGRGHGKGKPEGVPPDDGDTDGEVDGDAAAASDVDGNGDEPHRNAQVIADTFDVPVDEVTGLRESGIGFGAIFKLYMLDAAGDGTLAALESSAEGDGGFGFGKLFKESANGVSALTAGEDGMPKNLGQAKKAQK